MKHIRLFVRCALVITLSLPIAAAVGAIIWHAHGNRLLSVQTASMVPTFKPGDALIVRPVSPSELRRGDVISYHSRKNPSVIISHRLLGADSQTGQLVTAGDALHSQDPLVSPLQLVGRVTAVAPGLGRAFSDLYRAPVLLCTIYLPATALVGFEVRRLKQQLQRPTYLLDYRHGQKP